MGQGIQQPTMEQGGAGNAFADVVKVLFGSALCSSHSASASLS
jgi:hypothetical protein